ncbi:hypothetical protein L3Q82_013845, partial [Scortum barcoo]
SICTSCPVPQVLPVWELAIPLPAVLMITLSLYMVVLGIGLWIRYCLKDRCSSECADCCPNVSICEQCFRMAEVCDYSLPTVRQCLTDSCPSPSTKMKRKEVRDFHLKEVCCENTVKQQPQRGEAGFLSLIQSVSDVEHQCCQYHDQLHFSELCCVFSQCVKWDCACTCQPPECESCNCLCFEIRIK